MQICFPLQIIFLETLCNDAQIIERNIRMKIQQSPDYAEEYGCLLKLFITLINIDMHTYLGPSADQILRQGIKTSKID